MSVEVIWGICLSDLGALLIKAEFLSKSRQVWSQGWATLTQIKKRCYNWNTWNGILLQWDPLNFVCTWILLFYHAITARFAATKAELNSHHKPSNQSSLTIVAELMGHPVLSLSLTCPVPRCPLSSSRPRPPPAPPQPCSRGWRTLCCWGGIQ